MRPVRLLPAAVALLLLLVRAGPARATPPEPAAAARGEKAFHRYCISCHGLGGEGNGPTADWLDPRPRVLTSGIFKFRSTPSGELPTDTDLLRTITNGIHTTYMPHWAAMSEIERLDLVQYVKTLSPRFAAEPQGKPIPISPPPTLTRDLVARGKQVWIRLGCATCHGNTGRGDGPQAATLRDDWGTAILPYDFTRGPLKVGDGPEDLYRAFMTGLNGTPMPGYAKVLAPDEAWALVAYTRALRKR